MRYLDLTLRGGLECDAGADVATLRRRAQRYQRALRRCAERSRRETALRRAAEAAAAEKDRAMAAVCHDLRTPLNAMLGWTRVAVTAAPAENDELHEALARIESNARVQALLINDILDLARSASGTLRLDRKPIDLNDVVAAALAVVEPAAAAKAVRIDRAGGADPVVVLGDSVRLQQVVWNLLTNAVKFTPTGGRVNVELRAGERVVVLSVADTGRGITREFLPRIFHRYEQGHPEGGGVGLGLAIVRRLVQAHDGTVTADSAGEGRGATFTVSLPLPGRTTADGASAKPTGSNVEMCEAAHG